MLRIARASSVEGYGHPHCSGVRATRVRYGRLRWRRLIRSRRTAGTAPAARQNHQTAHHTCNAPTHHFFSPGIRTILFHPHTRALAKLDPSHSTGERMSHGSLGTHA